jgi:hypothetical protein
LDDNKKIDQYVQEAKALRAKLENLADAGKFNPVSHAADHQRLDDLERFLYRARKVGGES